GPRGRPAPPAGVARRACPRRLYGKKQSSPGSSEESAGPPPSGPTTLHGSVCSPRAAASTGGLADSCLVGLSACFPGPPRYTRFRSPRRPTGPLRPPGTISDLASLSEDSYHAKTSAAVTASLPRPSAAADPAASGAS